MPARSTGQAATTTPLPRPPATPDGSGQWSRRVQSFGRWGVLAIPVYALFAGLTQRDRDAFSTDPAVYAHYHRYGRVAPWELFVTLGLGISGVLGLIALAALAIRGRGRAFAVTGMLVGVGGSAALMTAIGSVVVRADRVRSAFFGGHWSRIAINAEAHGSRAGLLVAGGAILLTLGWMLLGVGVWRTPGLNRADGVMLVLSAPMLYIGGMALRTLPTMGSFLLLAAGLGIAAQARRAVVAADAPVPIAVAARSRAYSRLVGEDVYAEAADPEEFERDLDPAAAADADRARRATAAGVARTPRHVDHGVNGRVRPVPGISVARSVTRRRDDGSRSMARSGSRPDPAEGGGAPGTTIRPRSGWMGALAAILNGTMTLGRKEPAPAPAPTGGVAATPAARYGLDRPDARPVSPPAITTAPAGRSTTPSLANQVPGAPTPAAAKATNATSDSMPGDRKARSANAKGGKGKPGKD